MGKNSIRKHFLVNVITEFKKLVQLNNTIDEILDKIKTKKKIFFIFKKLFFIILIGFACFE